MVPSPGRVARAALEVPPGALRPCPPVVPTSLQHLVMDLNTEQGSWLRVSVFGAGTKAAAAMLLRQLPVPLPVFPSGGFLPAGAVVQLDTVTVGAADAASFGSSSLLGGNCLCVPEGVLEGDGVIQAAILTTGGGDLRRRMSDYKAEAGEDEAASSFSHHNPLPWM
jgi:hypothetical protein